MGLFDDLFGKAPYPPGMKSEVDKLINELLLIGEKEDYLSETPGGAFNIQCRHNRTRQIGKRLNEIGEFPLMEYVYRKVRKKLGNNLGEHLEYAWSDIGKWLS